MADYPKWTTWGKLPRVIHSQDSHLKRFQELPQCHCLRKQWKEGEAEMAAGQTAYSEDIP